MSAPRLRGAPPLWVLFDLLMVWILALISLVPAPDAGLRFEFEGLPVEAVLFAATYPLDAGQASWTHLDRDTARWVSGPQVTPFGRENFLCADCARFVPDGLHRPEVLLVSLPSSIRARIHAAFFAACATGACRPILTVHEDGTVSVGG